MLVTAPSQWLTDLAEESILGQRPVRKVPNAIDTDIYRPRDKATVRRKLGWPIDATILLFAAESLDNPFKDFRLLLAALKGLSADHLVLAVLGKGEGLGESIGGIQVIPLGYHEDEKTIAQFLRRRTCLFIRPAPTTSLECCLRPWLVDAPLLLPMLEVFPN